MGDGIGREFLERTKYRHLDISDQRKGVPQPPIVLPVPPDRPVFVLPDPTSTGLAPVDLAGLIKKRRSLRRYAGTPLSLVELSFLLWTTQGIKEAAAVGTLRTVPSAGARHAFETWLLLNRVETLEPGLYRYLPLDHKLALLRMDPGLKARMTAACLGQTFIESAAALFLWVAIVDRMTWRYGDRGYRYLYLDAGHICQNLYIGAEAIGAGACAIAAFDDEAVNTVLEIDGKDQIALYLAAVGKRA